MHVFDTARYHRGLGFSLAQCGNHKARAQRAEDDYHATQRSIDQLTIEKNNLLNGEQQAMYDNLKTKQEQLQIQISQLKTQIQQAYLLRDAWVNDPEKQAQLEGMGWAWFKRNFVKPLHNFISCDQWEKKEAHWKSQIHPLLSAKGVLDGELSEIRNRLSPDNLNLMQKAVQELEIEKSNLTQQLNGILKEIDDARNDHKTKKEAAIKAQENAKAGKNMMLWGGLGVAALVAVVVWTNSKQSKSKSKKVDM